MTPAPPFVGALCKDTDPASPTFGKPVKHGQEQVQFCNRSGRPTGARPTPNGLPTVSQPGLG